VAPLRTDVSEESIPSINRVTGIGKLGTTLAVTSSLTKYCVHILMMEVTCSSEMSVLTGATRRYIPQEGILHSHRRENLKSKQVTEYEKVNANKMY
jgi:hypothetical protein